MAASIMKSLQSSVDDSKIDLMEETDNELLSVNVLSLMNRDMKDHVKAPFRNESVLIRMGPTLSRARRNTKVLER